MIEPIDSLPVGVAAAVGYPKTTARTHHRVQSASHAAGWLNALDLSVDVLVLKGLPIRDYNQAIAVELSADELAEERRVSRPSRLSSFHSQR